jgi:chemotaxis protein methyltransferase CheR
MAKTVNLTRLESLYSSTLSDRDFRRLSKFIYNECGINLPEYKKILLESRLHKRIRQLKISSLEEYCNYLFSPLGMKTELSNMIDAITTNKTDFFRGHEHFDYLAQQILPELISENRAGFSYTLSVWSAGCSSGEEPYSLAMVLQDYSERQHSNRLDYHVLATDISIAILKKAQRAIYDHDQIKPVPYSFRKKYLLKGRKNIRDLIRIVPELRRIVQFKRLNFLDNDFDIPDPVDIIFCRNVIIYFDKATQEQVLRKMCHYLRPGGYLFMGHSETLNQITVPLVQVEPTIYKKPA